ncbi:MAG: hypothetical protein ABI273_00360 [Lacunisphaera sp.]
MSLDDFVRTSMNDCMALLDQTDGATATPPWWVTKPQRGRCGSRVGCWRAHLLLLAGALFVSGCRQLPTQPDSGSSSFRFVDGPPASPLKGKVTEGSNGPIIVEHYIEAEPILPVAMPVYPAHALAAKAGLVTIGVKISVDADGHVSNISPSLLTFSTPTRYSDEFDEAVRVAVSQWRFHPAQRYSMRIFRTAEGGGPPKETPRENTETYFDLAFTFTASGKVLSGGSIK